VTCGFENRGRGEGASFFGWMREETQKFQRMGRKRKGWLTKRWSKRLAHPAETSNWALGTPKKKERGWKNSGRVKKLNPHGVGGGWTIQITVTKKGSAGEVGKGGV